MQTNPNDDEDVVTYSSGNIFADLGLANADELLVKADLAHAINTEFENLGLTQAQLGERAGLTQAQVSRIGRMKLEDFSQERLQTVLRNLGVDVEIKLHTRDDGGIGTLKVYA